MKSRWFVALAFVSFVSINLTPAFAQQSLEQALQEFDQNPKAFMDKIPQKSGKPAVSKFTKQDIRTKAYVEAKNQNRKLKGRAAISGNDRPEALVDNPNSMVKNVEEMDEQGLTAAQLPESPWSDYYWALYAGQTAFRYADDNFNVSEDWKVNADYVLNPANFSSVDILSPAEKYDLLVGDQRKTLTNTALGEGEQYYRSYKKVEAWMGICHGWAPAAYMLERPSKAVKVMAADGKTMITFYPSDIKALASLLWAKTNVPTKFIGGRCNVKDPKKNAVGRVIDQECFDNNPGAWHTAVVNQIAVNKRSFVLDATFDYEVWNQPVYAYQYTYFNPQTMRPVKSLKSAMIPMEKFSKDKFKEFRSKKAAYVVGVAMTMAYTVETMPTASKTDSEKNDAYKTVQYIYDLELDENGDIIGGEWYTNLHPDFLWTPAKDAKAKTPGDQMLARYGADRIEWNGKTAMPREWSDIAKRNSSGGAPMAKIVESLIDISNAKVR